MLEGVEDLGPMGGDGEDLALEGIVVGGGVVFVVGEERVVFFLVGFPKGVRVVVDAAHDNMVLLYYL